MRIMESKIGVIKKTKTKPLSESNSSSKWTALWLISSENMIWINLKDQLQEIMPKCKDFYACEEMSLDIFG